MIYDGEGNLVKWIVVTDGALLTVEDVAVLRIDVLLLKSPHGGLTSTMLKNATICINRFNFTRVKCHVNLISTNFHRT